MGLLDRAVLSETLQPLSVDGLTGRDTGLLERPTLLLNGMGRTWGLDRGALLSLDRKTNTLVPLEITGFDTTTRRRLILERERAVEWLGGKRFFLLRDSGLYGSYFSAREMGLSSSLLGISFQSEESGLFALVLFLLDEDDRRGAPSPDFPFSVEGEIETWLYKALFPSEKADRDRITLLEEEELHRTLLTEGEDSVLLRIPLTPLLEYVTSRESLKESFDSRNEILGLFASFFNERVQLYIDRRDSLFILQPRELFPGVRLMENQIRLSLEQLVGAGIGEDLISLSVLPNPGIKRDLEQFLNP